MSQENVDKVLRGIEALNQGDVVGALAPFHPDLAFEDAGTGVTSSGRDAMGAWIRDFLASYSEYSETPEDVVDLGEQVVLHMRTDATGQGSGVSISTHHAEIHTFGDDGLVSRLTVYPTYEAALEASGLKEAQASAALPPRRVL